MRLNWRQRLAFKIKFRYKIKRRIFTLVIPCVIALLFFFFSFHFGFASTSVAGTGFIPGSAPNTSNSTLAQKEFEFLLLSNPNASVTSIITKIPNPNLPKEKLDIVLVATPLIAFTPYAVDITRAERKTRKYEEDFAAFLFELAELVRGGIDPLKGFQTLSEKSTGTITKFVQNSAKQLQIGYSFEQAMVNLGNQINTSLVKKYVDLVIQASYSGGSVSGLIQKASQDMSTFIAIDKEKRSGLAQYTMILYVGQVILIALAAILVVEFLPSLNNITSIGEAGINGLLGGSDIASVTVERDMFYLVLINGFLGGLVIGKISEGKLKYGLKHSLILITIALIAWSGFVTPFASSQAQVQITVVSYQRSGTVGYPQVQPLVVQIKNAQGKILNGTDVFFSISPSGTVNPKLALTDANGTASTSIILGDTPGIYYVTVQVQGTETKVPILVNGSSSS